MSLKIVQITDLHVTKPGERIGGIDTAARLEALIAHINSEQADTDLVVATGDLTNWGDLESFERLKSALERLRFETALLIGNHDDRETFKTVFAGTATDAHGFVQYRLERGGHRLLMMDTVESETHAGHYDARRLAWLEAELKGSAIPCILFMHHPPMPVGMPGTDLIGQLDHEALAQVLRRHAGKIRYMLFGHCHMPISASYLGIPAAGIRSSCNRQGWPDFAERHTLNACDLPPAYAVLLVEEGVILHHTIDYLYDGRIDRGISPAFEAWQRAEPPG